MSKLRRPGHSLVEMVLMTAIISAVLGTIGVATHAMFQADRRIREELVSAAAETRLAAQFRADVHAARRTDVISPSELRLELESGWTVLYERIDSEITRAAMRGSEQVRRESFRVVEASDVSWRHDTSGRAPLVVMALDKTTIEAVEGLHRRLGL